MVSVAMAVFNGEKYLQAQLDSVLAQEGVDFELVVVDDASEDGSLEILRNAAKKDARIRLFENKERLGYAPNFQKAIENCRGEYIALCDQDDVWFKNHLKVLLNAIENYDAASALAFATDKNLQKNEKIFPNVENILFHEALPLDRALFRRLHNACDLPGCVSLFKKSFLEEALPFPKDFSSKDWYLQNCAILKNGIKRVFEPISFYRCHGANLSHSKKSYWPRIFRLASYFFPTVHKAKTTRQNAKNRALGLAAYSKKIEEAKKTLGEFQTKQLLEQAKTLRQIFESLSKGKGKLRAAKYYLKNQNTIMLFAKKSLLRKMLSVWKILIEADLVF